MHRHLHRRLRQLRQDNQISFKHGLKRLYIKKPLQSVAFSDIYSKVSYNSERVGHPTLSLMLDVFLRQEAENGMAKEDISAKVTALLEEYTEGRELEIYRVIYKKEGPDWVLRVFLDKPMGAENEYVSIEECEEATRYLSDKLDELDLIERSYNLEISSPGLDRELIKDTDFVRFAGREVEVKTYGQIDGSKNFEGTLIGKEGDTVIIDKAGKRLEIPSDKISKINLAIVF